MTAPKNLYWDSCCFIRLITNQPSDHVADMMQYISDARQGKLKIHFSTIAYAEIRPRYFKRSRWRSIGEFFENWGNAFLPFDPNPNILIRAGALRDIDPVNPSDPNIDEERKRRLGAADAVHLSTCLYIKDIGERDIVFHTFDEGKGGTTHEGRCVPLIGFERWYPSDGRHELIQSVCDLTRCKPSHPNADLATQANKPTNVTGEGNP